MVKARRMPRDVCVIYASSRTVHRLAQLSMGRRFMRDEKDSGRSACSRAHAGCEVLVVEAEHRSRQRQVRNVSSKKFVRLISVVTKIQVCAPTCAIRCDGMQIPTFQLFEV